MVTIKQMVGKTLTFVRIPKNASTSIFNHIGNLNTITDDSVESLRHSHIHQGFFAPSHCSLSEAVDIVGEEILSKVIFAVCRNPYDRMVSQYCFAQQKQGFPISFEDFEEFVNFCVQKKTIGSFTQSHYLDIDIDINVLRFENLDNDFGAMVEKHNISVNPTLPKTNSTNRKHYLEYYTTTLKDKVKDLWEEDFKRFEYEL